MVHPMILFGLFSHPFGDAGFRWPIHRIFLFTTYQYSEVVHGTMLRPELRPTVSRCMQTSQHLWRCHKSYVSWCITPKYHEVVP